MRTYVVAVLGRNGLQVAEATALDLFWARIDSSLATCS